MINSNLNIGINNSNNKTYLSTANRLQHLNVIGNNNYEQHYRIFVSLIQQDIKNKDVGCTLFTCDEQLAYTIYAMAKQEKRKVTVIDYDLMDFNILQTMNGDNWNTVINEQLINFEKAIASKTIIIIKANDIVYGKQSLILTDCLLKSIYMKSRELSIMKDKLHYLYMDRNIKETVVNELLQYSSRNNLGIISFSLKIPENIQLYKNILYYSSLLNSDYKAISEYIQIRMPEKKSILDNLNEMKSYSCVADITLGRDSRNLSYLTGLDEYKDFEWIKALDELLDKGLKYRKKQMKLNEKIEKDIIPEDNKDAIISNVEDTESKIMNDIKKEQEEVIEENVIKVQTDSDEPDSVASEVINKLNKREDELIQQQMEELTEEDILEKKENVNNYFTTKIEFCDDVF